MPTVPRRGLGYTPYTPEPFGPGVQPVDTGPATRELSRIVEEHQQKADQSAVLEADNKLSDLRTNLEVQALQTRGKDALSAGPAVQEAWKKGSSDIANTLTTDRQKEAFQARTLHHWSMLNETVTKHGAQEFDNWNTANTDSALANRRKDAVDAVLNNSDPAIIGQSLAETHDLVALYGQHNGWSPEQMQEKQTAAASGIHSDVIKTLADTGKDLAAKQYFEAHKGELAANDVIRAAQVVKESSVKGESQRQRDLILSTASSTADAIAIARQIKDPDVQEATERLVRQDLSERAAAQRDQREQTMTELGNTIDQGGIGAIPPSKWSTLNPSEKTSLLEYAKKKQDPGGVTTDLPTFYKLETMSSSPETRDAFLETDLNTLRGKLSPSDFKHFTELQASVRKGEASAEAKNQFTQNKHQTVGTVMNAALIGISKKGRVTDVQQRSQFRAAVDAEITRVQSGTKTPVTVEQVRQIANELATQRIVQTQHWYGNTSDQVRTFQLHPGDKVVLGIKDVPSDQRAQIQQALRQRGKPVTDAAVVDWYRRYVQSLAPEPE